MRQSFANLVQHIGLTEADAIRLTSTNPKLAIGLVSS
jgi:N-acetylglucosamine-6-phosphate deacetylase